MAAKLRLSYKKGMLKIPSSGEGEDFVMKFFRRKSKVLLCYKARICNLQ
jgi:hypothetical protein